MHWNGKYIEHMNKQEWRFLLYLVLIPDKKQIENNLDCKRHKWKLKPIKTNYEVFLNLLAIFRSDLNENGN